MKKFLLLAFAAIVVTMTASSCSMQSANAEPIPTQWGLHFDQNDIYLTDVTTQARTEVLSIPQGLPEFQFSAALESGMDISSANVSVDRKGNVITVSSNGMIGNHDVLVLTASLDVGGKEPLVSECRVHMFGGGNSDNLNLN